MTEISMMMHGAMGAWMLLWAFVAVAILVLAVATTVWLVRRPSGSGERPPLTETPEEILRRRYAAGEIDEDEYLRRQSGLR